LRRIINLYVSPAGEDLGKVANAIDEIISETRLPEGVRVELRGMVQGMRSSFVSFGTGLILAVVLLFLILVASFRSFKDPFLILLAVPPGVTGVLLTLYLTGTTLNVQSLMGIVMMVGIVVSNSILIVEFAHRLREEGMSAHDAIVTGAWVRLRPIVMSALATLMGLLPMALKLGTGSEAYAPLARAILGGLMVSIVLTIFAVPAAYYLFYREPEAPVAQPVTEKGDD
jgi:multidrug efflux pump subunit AcrB